MKLTKAERHTLYIIMLAEALYKYKSHSRQSSIGTGFCRLFVDILGSYALYNNFNLLPELGEKRTRRGDSYFFNNWNERISALKKCIEETYNAV